MRCILCTFNVFLYISKTHSCVRAEQFTRNIGWLPNNLFITYRQVFQKATCKKEYLRYTAKLIHNIRQKLPKAITGPSPGPGLASSCGVLQQQGHSLGGMMSSVTPSPSSTVSQEYLEKVKSLEKYIEPLRAMIAKIGNEQQGQERLTKMKKLLDILLNLGRHMPIQTLQKCEDVLKRMALVCCPQSTEDIFVDEVLQEALLTPSSDTKQLDKEVRSFLKKSVEVLYLQDQHVSFAAVLTFVYSSSTHNMASYNKKTVKAQVKISDLCSINKIMYVYFIFEGPPFSKEHA